MSMHTQRVTRRTHRNQRAQTLVEFAFVAPIAVLLLLGIIGGCWLFFQSSSLTDSARSAARMASMETSLESPNASGQKCESALPTSIEQAAQNGALQLRVNQSPLCLAAGSTTRLVQTSYQPSQVNITVDAYPDASAPQSVTVTVTYPLRSVAGPFQVFYPSKVTSTVPVIKG